MVSGPGFGLKTGPARLISGLWAEARAGPDTVRSLEKEVGWGLATGEGDG